MSERGFTIVLIDSDDGSEGDFVYVESFANADAIAAESERVIGSVLAAARGIEARDEEVSGEQA